MDSVFSYFSKIIVFSFIVGGALTSCVSPPAEEPISFAQKRVLFLGNSITQNGTYISFLEYFLRQAFPHESFDFIGLGLGSETVSGLTEKDHPFPRPCVLERLDAALDKVKPDVVVLCYGMNDGIYHPFSPRHLIAFQSGFYRLISKVYRSGADIIIQTPPPFDSLPIADKTVGLEAPEYSYRQPYAGYDSVLERYSEWLIDDFQDSFPVVDLHQGVNEFLAEQRLAQPGFTLAEDGIHPNERGHLLMATLFLRTFALAPTGNLDEIWAKVSTDPLFRLFNIKRRIISEAWLPYVGYVRGDTVQAPGLGNLEEELMALETEIKKMLPKIDDTTPSD